MKRLTTSASDKPLYAALGLPQTATTEEIHAAFLRIASQHHPDKCGGVESDLFTRAKRAHDILMDPEKRAVYDETGLNPDDSENRLQVAAIGMIRQIAFGILSDGNTELDLVMAIRIALDRESSGLSTELRRMKEVIANFEKGAAAVEKRWKNGEHSSA